MAGSSNSLIDQFSSAVISFFKKRKDIEAEQNRPKNYQDLMEYAARSSANFPENVRITPFETVVPYYGQAAESELAAAAKYAKQLESAPEKKVEVSPSYYEAIKNQIPVTENPDFSGYSHKEKRMVIQSPRDIQKSISSLSNIQRDYAGYGTKAQTAEYLSPENAPKAFRDVAEHEAFHSLDKNIKFLSDDTKGKGYMATNEHIPTGLAKVQREHYALTGRRFETPEEFKSFIVNLAKLENPESGMLNFSEEAKRAIRTQVYNIKSDIQLIPWFINNPEKLKEYSFGPRIKEKLDFLEKSAQLIPGLVQTGARNKSSV